MRWWAASPLAITDADRDDVSLSLQPSMSLQGRVVIDQAAGASDDTTRYSVSLAAMPGPMGFRTSSRAQPGADGHFLVVNLTPGRYRLTVTASSGPPPRVVAVIVAGQTATGAEIEVHAGTNIEDVVVRVDPSGSAPNSLPPAATRR